MKYRYAMNKLILLLFALAISNQVTAQTIPALISPNFKYGEIYYGESDSAVAYDEDWREVCRKLGLQLTKVPGGKFCEYKSTNPLYLWLGDICLDGSYRFSGRGQHCDQDIARCPDSSWTLSADQKTCYRPNDLCAPDIQLVSDVQLLAAIAYGEASIKDNYEEMSGIASATLRSMAAWNYTSLKEFVAEHKNYTYVITDGNQRYKSVMCADDQDKYEKAFLASENALKRVEDYAVNGCFWDGKDLKTKGAQHKKYQRGFLFRDPSHNIYGVNAPPPNKRHGPHGFYSYVYESTAAVGGTIFWKYTQEYLKAMGVKQCR